MSVSRSWVFTLNNWVEEDKQKFLDFEKKYLVLGEEVSETGTAHLQGFIIWTRAYRLAQLKKLVPRAHWEVAKAKDAGNYCMKESYTVQDNRRQGKRTDLELACKKSRKDLLEETPEMYVKYHSGFDKLHAMMWKQSGPRNVEVHWLWGDSGTGKTRSVFEKHGYADVCSVSLSGNPGAPFWNGYFDETVVLLDDIRAGQISLASLLRATDIYPVKVNIKGGFAPLRAEFIYITSPFPPEKVFEDCNEDIGQLRRRITKCTHFSSGLVALAQ